MDEVEHLADRVVVIANGEIVAEGTPQTLAGRDELAATIRFTLPALLGIDELPAALRQLAEGDAGAEVTLRSTTPLQHTGELAVWAADCGIDLPDLEVRRPTLEDMYLLLTDHGKDAR